MRIALFSPMPPSRSGIADYTAALLEPLQNLANVDVFDGVSTAALTDIDRARYDCALYQIGNNSYHAFAYRQALNWPGIVVIHEANLHHLIAEMTIRNGEWDEYVEAVRYDAGDAALEHAQRVRKREVGPDYIGVPMLRRLLDSSRAAIVHSRFVEGALRGAGFQGPTAVIPHGAWTPQVDRLEWRHKLRVEPQTPLFGIFGFLKPYKRIAQALRAFQRLVRLNPSARMILVGEPHPELPIPSMLASLGIAGKVRILGRTEIDEFVGYMAACDVVLNLRYPTVGESSGTHLRALGLGRAVIVSDVGSFSEFPDEICLKVPVDAHEEDTLFEYMRLLAERPEVRQTLGKAARIWVERECNWDSVAERYVQFIDSVVHAKPCRPQEPPELARSASAPDRFPAVPDAAPPAAIAPEYVLGWSKNEESRQYVATHITRLMKTLELVPRGGPGKSVLEMGIYLQITPALRDKLGYGEVRGCYYGPKGTVEHRQIVSSDGQPFSCEVDLFDAERDVFPYEDGSFDTVLCCELLEHLHFDPMHMMSEINRVLKPGGSLVLTTPNITSLRALSAMLQGYHPGFFPAYIKPAGPDGEADARHAREYAPGEIAHLLQDSGFDVALLETGEFRDEPHPEYAWINHLLTQYGESTDLRGDGIYAVGTKRGRVRRRYPDWLYT